MCSTELSGGKGWWKLGDSSELCADSWAGIAGEDGAVVARCERASSSGTSEGVVARGEGRGVVRLADGEAVHDRERSLRVFEPSTGGTKTRGESHTTLSC